MLSSRTRSAQTGIDAYDIRLAARRTTLEWKFAGSSRPSWVTGQGSFLAGLMQQNQR